MAALFGADLCRPTNAFAAYEGIINEARAALQIEGSNLDPGFVFRKLRAARVKSKDCAKVDPTRQRFPEIDSVDAFVNFSYCLVILTAKPQ